MVVRTKEFICVSKMLCRFSVIKTSNSQRSFFWILVDDQRYAHYVLYSSGSGTPPGSITITLELNAGQIVRVENEYSSIVYGIDATGAIRSWFTGHMI